MHPIVTRLIERKLVSRRPDPAGGRAYLIRLTDKGSTTIEACDRASQRVEEGLFGTLSSAEHKAVQRALGKCVNAKLRARSSKAARTAQWPSKKEKVNAVPDKAKITH
jgi:DNA-binding MarR family transcriptional regulator